jgi:hypothetical protein
MKFCKAHWDKLRAAIDERGLSGLVHQGGAAATEAMARELQGTATDRDFDPLMAAHWAIVNNASRVIADTGGNPLYLMTDGPEDPLTPEGIKAARGLPLAEGTTWPRCPLCYVNLAHKVSCKEDGCTIDREAGFDWMIARAAEDALATAREKHLAPENQ